VAGGTQKRNKGKGGLKKYCSWGCGCAQIRGRICPGRRESKPRGGCGSLVKQQKKPKSRKRTSCWRMHKQTAAKNDEKKKTRIRVGCGGRRFESCRWVTATSQQAYKDMNT